MNFISALFILLYLAVLIGIVKIVNLLFVWKFCLISPDDQNCFIILVRKVRFKKATKNLNHYPTSVHSQLISIHSAWMNNILHLIGGRIIYKLYRLLYKLLIMVPTYLPTYLPTQPRNRQVLHNLTFWLFDVF